MHCCLCLTQISVAPGSRAARGARSEHPAWQGPQKCLFAQVGGTRSPCGVGGTRPVHLGRARLDCLGPSNHHGKPYALKRAQLKNCTPSVHTYLVEHIVLSKRRSLRRAFARGVHEGVRRSVCVCVCVCNAYCPAAVYGPHHEG
jgi:hypothetical protein